MRGKIASMISIASALAIVAASCTDEVPTPPIDRKPSGAQICREDPFGCVRVEPGNPIRLAALLALGQADPGGEARFATELAVNHHARVFGHDIELVIQGDDCSPVGVSMLNEDPTIAAVIGSGCGSHWPRIAAEVLSEKGVLFVSATSTGPDLTHPRTHPLFFVRTTYNDGIQGLAMARFVREKLRSNTAAGVHDRSPYAVGLVTGFASEFSSGGGRIVARQALRVGRTSYRPLLNRIEKVAPDFIYAPVFVAEGGVLASQAREIGGLRHTLVGGADGMLTPDWVDYAGRAAEGVYLSGPTPKLDQSRFAHNFLPFYQRRFGRQPPGFRFHLATAFDATNMVLDAIEDVALQEEGVLYIPRTDLRDRMFATKDYPGLSGTLTCDPNGDCNHSTRVVIYQVRNGAFRKAWTWDPTA